eukprot:TRINITY_DN87576_c0_g1_i1.p1 TRINITY_DN87576_c0_g1~~TRINITY_DN87576_c0_g1_i1.p1  ORF type:complete len:194 (-),score=20.70 TRINITY_DN87576_c0_g1_i1:16-597(-)
MLAAGQWLWPSRAFLARGFARRSLRPAPVPAVVKLGEEAPAGGTPALTGDRDWSSGFPRPGPRRGGFNLKIQGPRGGAIPRLGRLITPGEGVNHSPFDDPSSPLPHAPIEPDQPPKPWKVLRSHNGNIPVYTRYRGGGTEITTLVRHFFGDAEAMRKDLMQVCEAPVRLRAGKLEVRGLHKWKIKEWLMSLGM